MDSNNKISVIMRLSLVFQKSKNGLKLLITILLALYIHLWFSKVDDNSKKLSGSLEKTSQSLAKDYITLVSYNMWCNYLAKTNSNYIERFEGFVKGIKHVDIVLVQEIFILRVGPLEFSNCATQMIDNMEEEGFKYRTRISDTVPYIFGQTNGLAIFSKIPFTKTKSVVFSDSTITERLNNKGFVVAELLVSGKKVTVINIHSDAHNAQIRELQMNQLKSFISENKSPYVIVGGDFNFDSPQLSPENSNRAEYKNLVLNMESVGLKPLFTEQKKTHLDGGSYDNIFLSSSLRIKERNILNLLTVKGEMVSDHFGLFVKIKL